MKLTAVQLLGHFIRARRIERGLSQVEFSERCGIYQTYLSRLERGQANPSVNALEIVANALGLSLFELFQEAADFKVTKGQASPKLARSARARR